MYRIAIEESLRVGWEKLKIYGGIFVGAGLVYVIVSAIIGLIPIINFIYNIFVGPIWAIGFIFMILKMMRNEQPEFSDSFRGFDRFGALLGFNILTMIIGMIILLPSIGYIIAIAFKYGNYAPTELGFSAVLMMLLNGLILLLIYARFMFVNYILMDDYRVSLVDAIKLSSNIVKGNYDSLILYMIVSTILTLIGYILLIIPGIILSLVVYISYGYIYLRLMDNYRSQFGAGPSGYPPPPGGSDPYNPTPGSRPPHNPPPHPNQPPPLHPTPPPPGQTPPPPPPQTPLPNDQKSPDHPYGQ